MWNISMPFGEKVVDLVKRPENLRLCHRKPGRLLEELSNGIFPDRGRHLPAP